ncbi:RDD family protein [Enterococcus sp. DIV0876]|uniref:RDD family protein n=1 Tax=Enterococcus sp. DIV0876 TaxID=2774633 RepID=UPI003D2FD421
MNQEKQSSKHPAPTQDNTNGSHPDDFYQQVLSSFEKKAYTEEAIKENQREWQQYEMPDQQAEQPRPINDFPNYFYAGFWIRLFAFVVDLILIHSVTEITIGSVYRLSGLSAGAHPFGIYQLVSLAIYLAYFVLLTKYNHGQTIGKMIFGIRVISFQEEVLSWQTVLIRELCGRYVLQFYWLFYLGYLPTIFSKNKQHAADYFADTSVVTINMIKAFNNHADVHQEM